MSFLSGIGDWLKQPPANRATPAPAPGSDKHFGQVAQAVPGIVAGGLTETFRSGQTTSFPQRSAQRFTRQNSQKHARVTTGLLVAPGPGVIAQSAPEVSQLPPGAARIRLRYLGQAVHVSPAEVQTLTGHAQNQDPSIIDRGSAVYAEHPVLIKSLDAAALILDSKKPGDLHAA